MKPIDFTSLPGYQEIVQLIQLFESMPVDECVNDSRRETAVAFAVSRLRSASLPDQKRDEIIARIKKLEFDPMIDYDYNEDGELEYAYFKSQELGEQADTVLTYRFKRDIKRELLEALSFCEPVHDKSSAAQQPPRISLAFIEDRTVQSMLVERWNEAWQCTSLGLLLSASAVLGSVLEGALVYYFEFVADQTVRDKYKLGADSDRWKLFKLVEAVVAEVKFRGGVPELTDQIREERNYIHPNVSMKSEPLTVEGLQTNFAIISELLARLSGHAAKVKP